MNRKRSILLVDDKLILRATNRQILLWVEETNERNDLADLPHIEVAVRLAYGGTDALIEFFGTPPDLIITDLDMGQGSNGFVLAEKIRNLKTGTIVPIIVHTAGQIDDNARAAAKNLRCRIYEKDPNILKLSVIKTLEEWRLIASVP